MTDLEASNHGVQSDETRKRLIVWIVLLSLTGIVLLILLRPKPQLLDHATRIARADTWQKDYPGYFWKSDHEILARQDTGFNGVRFVCFDTRTGQERSLPQLSQQLSAGRWNTEAWRISPDGQWLLARGVGKRGSAICKAFAVDGSRQVTWPINPSSSEYIHWLPDSRRWLELNETSHGIQTFLHDLNGHTTHGLTLPGLISWPLNVTKSGYLLSVLQKPGETAVTEFKVTGGTPSWQKALIPMPLRADTLEVEPSPDGSRIAFLTVSVSHSPAQSLVQSLFPAFHLRQRNFTLWLSNVDGTAMHEVGTQRGQAFAGIQWTPDGQHLSLFYENALYTIAAK